MKPLHAILPCLAMAGCGSLPVVEIHSAPVLPREEVSRLAAHRTRTVAVDAEAVFPKVLEILLDQGHLILCADRSLGMVAFRQQWQDREQRKASIIQDGSLLVTPLEPGRSRLRLLLAGRSSEVFHYGMKESAGLATLAGVQHDLAPEEYAKLLDLLEKGLVAQGAPPQGAGGG
ncbi:hypothetical protein [Geothrix sp. 21YS21S-2]|uniref:hypothetical protein n=1 Tax=Geothrix sp. 21YS21S-2 TaxID=3068893 RepID=UPI0027BAE179|nr:hypothetical protein [Geothrix sp. 21YS21S-2]